MRTISVIALVLSPLAGGVAIAQTAPTSAPTAAKADKPICRRWAEIGQLVAAHKECHTKAEWDAMASANNADARAAMERRMGASPQ